ncbi:MAG: GAF domain-containing sensor histidine kinase, partial [Vicinamibacterales bacterium]
MPDRPVVLSHDPLAERTSGGLHRRASSLLAWSLWGCCVACTLGALVIGWLSIGDGGTWFDLAGAAFVTGFLVFPTVGALVAARHPSNAIGWLFLAVGICWSSLNFLIYIYANYALLDRPGELPGGVLAAWIVTWGWVPGLGIILTFLLLLFPDGRLPGSRWRIVGWLAVVSMVVACSAMAVDPDPLGAEHEFETTPNPLGVERFESILSVLEQAGLAVMFISALASVASLVYRFRRSDHLQRQQIKWVVFAASLVVAGFLADGIARGLSDGHDGGIVSVMATLTLFAVPVAAGIAILQHHLFDIDVIINRTLVFGALTVCVVAIYVLIVGYFGRLLSSGENLTVSLIATGVVAVLFQPLRARLQRGVNRLLYGERDDPYGVISRLGQRLESTIAPDAVLPAITETIVQTLKLPYVAIALRQGDGFSTMAVSGAPRSETVTLPLVYQSETVGQLQLAPRRPGEPLSTADRRVLAGIAHQAGIAAHAVQLSADLQRSRERLVMTREEERRRLRRDLHDGLGPILTAVTLKADAAR